MVTARRPKRVMVTEEWFFRAGRLKAENPLRLHVERLQGALRRVAADLDEYGDQGSADLDTRSAALRAQADSPVGVLL